MLTFDSFYLQYIHLLSKMIKFGPEVICVLESQILMIEDLKLTSYSEYLLRIRYICLISIEDFLSLPIKTSFKYTDLIEPTMRTCSELLVPFNHFIDR